MPVVPQNPVTSLPMQGQPFGVYLGGQDGVSVTSEDLSSELQLVSLTRSAGGTHLDHCTVALSLGAKGRHLIDLNTPLAFERKLQVRLAVPAEDDAEQDQEAFPAAALFSGEVATQAVRLGRDTEAAMLTARIEPWHFGDPLMGPKFLDVDGVTILEPDLPILFNPEIDGVVEPNMSSLAAPPGDTEDFPLWLDPESRRTTPAETLQDQEAVAWDLAHAVLALCSWANRLENFVDNPTIEELQGVIEEPPELRNIKLERGKRLPELLDALLSRFGYSWFVQPVIEETDAEGEELTEPLVTNHIRVFKLGAGQEAELYLQRPGTTESGPIAVDAGKSNVPDLGIDWNIADMANEIIGEGALLEIEGTFELYRAWPDDDDDLTADQLHKVDESSDEIDLADSVFLAHPNAWRKWVLNEAGDYCNTRTGAAAPIGDTPFDLKPFLGDQTVVKRRRFHHCLTKDQEGERRDVFVQYRDPDVAGDSDPGAWKALPHETWSNVGYHVLDKECGIYFSGATPPAQLMELDDTSTGAARIRVTAVLHADQRLTATSADDGKSPNGNTIKLFVDLSDRFHYRNVRLTGANKSALRDEPYGSHEIDDGDLLQTYVDNLRDVEQAARIGCEFSLVGINASYEIGQLVTKVRGRNLVLNRNAPDQAAKLYPQITAIAYDRESQRTVIRVETFDFSPRALRKLTL